MSSRTVKFHRSVNIARDLDRLSDISAYHLGPTSHAHAENILRNLETPDGERAWSLSGPYGSGKSAFLLYLSWILRGAETFEGRSFGEWQVEPIVCTRSSLRSQISRQLSLPSDESALEHLRLKISAIRSGGGRGMVIILDELNRVLEFMAEEPGKAEISFLQDLAELAGREDGLLLVTAQHVSFADYVGVSASRELLDEWKKIQGRFRDLSFFLSQGEMLRQIADALDSNRTHDQVEKRVQLIRDSGLIVDASVLQDLERADGLDPILTMILASAFRSSLSQNQRSVYTFLYSEEQFGLRKFANDQNGDSTTPRLYQLPNFFDYLIDSFGPQLFSGTRAHHWNEVTARLDRLPIEKELPHAVVKSVFLLNEFGSTVGLRADDTSLKVSLGEFEADLVEGALSSLVEEGVLRYRSTFSDYALIGASGYSLDRALDSARSSYQNATLIDLVEICGFHVSSRISRRHHAKTGNLRKVDRVLIGSSKLDSFTPQTVADLTEVFIVDESGVSGGSSPVDQVRSWLEKHPVLAAESLVAVVATPVSLIHRLRSLAAIRHVLSGDVELQGDSIALLEAHRYHDVVEQEVRQEIGPILGIGGHQLDPSKLEWPELYPAVPSLDQLRELEDAKLQAKFSKAPRIVNELLNRSTPSSAAARARRVLIERMLSHSSEEDLGISGNPAELGLYKSFLYATGVHRSSESGDWGIVRPDGMCKEIWNAIDAIFSGTDSPVNVSEILNRLQSPPLGIAPGAVTLFFVAYILSEGENFALYEQETFVPVIGPEPLERLQRHPGRFSARRVLSTSSQQQMLDVYSRVLVDLGVVNRRLGSIVSVARELILSLVKLPDYAQKTRKGLEATSSRQLREAVMRSQDPYELLIVELPELLGFQHKDLEEELAEFETRLTLALSGLYSAYENLLGFIARTAERELGVQARGEYPFADTADQLVEFQVSGRAGLVAGALRIRAGDWRENLGRAVMSGKPPSTWVDRDVPDFELEMRRIAVLLLDLLSLKHLRQDHPRNINTMMLTVAKANGEVRYTRTMSSADADTTQKVEEAADNIGATVAKLGLTKSEAVSVLLNLAISYGELRDAE